MSLNVTSLRQAFLAWFSVSTGTPSASQAEVRFARIYHSYAKEGEDVSGEKATNLTGTKFQGPLQFQRSETARDFCRQLDAAFVAYWTGAIFAVGVVPPPTPPCPNVGGTGIFATEITSAVVTVTPRVLYNLLLPIVSITSEAAQPKALQIADAFDSATKSAVSVLITGTDTTPGPSGPLPVTNTCTVF